MTLFSSWPRLSWYFNSVNKGTTDRNRKRIKRKTNRGSADICWICGWSFTWNEHI